MSGHQPARWLSPPRPGPYLTVLQRSAWGWNPESSITEHDRGHCWWHSGKATAPFRGSWERDHVPDSGLCPAGCVLSCSRAPERILRNELRQTWGDPPCPTGFMEHNPTGKTHGSQGSGGASAGYQTARGASSESTSQARGSGCRDPKRGEETGLEALQEALSRSG